MNTRFTISLPDDPLDALDHQLVGRDETRSSVIRRLIQEALREAEERREVERYIRGYQADPQTVEELGWADQVAPAGLSVEPLGVSRGEVWWANLPPPWGRRPVVPLARDEAYDVLTWVAVAPLTTHIRDIPTAVRLEPDRDGVPRRCAVSLDNVQSLRKDWVTDFIVPLGAHRMVAIDRALRFALGIRSCR